MVSYSDMADAAEAALLDVLQNGQEIEFEGVVYSKANVTALQNIALHYRSLAALSASNTNILQRRSVGITARW